MHQSFLFFFLGSSLHLRGQILQLLNIISIFFDFQNGHHQDLRISSEKSQNRILKHRKILNLYEEARV